jgi:hypothetical protein
VLQFNLLLSIQLLTSLICGASDVIRELGGVERVSNLPKRLLHRYKHVPDCACVILKTQAVPQGTASTIAVGRAWLASKVRQFVGVDREKVNVMSLLDTVAELNAAPEPSIALELPCHILYQHSTEFAQAFYN